MRRPLYANIKKKSNKKMKKKNLFSVIFLLIIFLIGCTKNPSSPSDDLKNYKIAFVSNRNGIEEIFIMNDEGTDQQKITNGLAQGGDAAWSLDGQTISFISEERPDFSISIVNTDGSNQHKISSNIGSDYPAYYYHLNWSPSSKKIAFVSCLDNNRDIAVIDVETHIVTRLTDNPEEDKDPSWSPDESKIAYVSKKSGIDYLYVMSADGSNIQNLTEEPLVGDKIRFPCWSPNGSKILFINTIGKSMYHQIGLINSDGSNLIYINPSPINLCGLPYWSLDGKKLTYSKGNYINDGHYITELYEIKANGTEKRLIAEVPMQGVFKWSPGRDKILIESFNNERIEIFTIESKGENLKQLTTEGGDDAAWSPINLNKV